MPAVMMDPNDYTTAWIVYLCAALAFSVMSWRILRLLPWRGLAFLLECWLVALLFTPAYVLPEAGIMAPALMVFALDAITIEPTAGIRALIPLVLALALGLVAAIALTVVSRIRRGHRAPAADGAPPREPVLAGDLFDEDAAGPIGRTPVREPRGKRPRRR